MTVDLTSGAGLFDRLGALGSCLHALQTFSNANARLTRTIAQQLLIEMVHADAALSAKTVALALAELVEQMVAGGETVDAAEPTAAVSYASGNTGNGVVVVGLRDAQGRRAELAYDEAMIGNCTSSPAAGSEQFRFQGRLRESNKLSPNWPAGSGANRVVTSSRAGGSANRLSGGDFETWVASTPSGWTVTVAGGLALESSTVYVGTGAAKITGDGSTLTQIRQAVTGLAANTPYAVGLFSKMGSAPAAGIATIDLYDGAAIIQDDAGNNQSFTIDLTTLGTSWTGRGAVFVLPSPVPTNVYLRVRLSTALENAKVWYVDEISLKEATLAYAGGPYLAQFTGSTAWAVGDRATVDVTNDYRGGFQQLCEQFFDLAANGIVIPSATGGGETIDDALIVT